MDGVKVYSKIRFRELNLGGPNNVKSLNELEDRLLRTSITSLEKAKKRSLSRLNYEVKDLHHTLREQNTVKPVSTHLIKKVYGDGGDFRVVEQPKSPGTNRTTADVFDVSRNDECSSESGDSESDEDENDDEDKEPPEEKKEAYKDKTQPKEEIQINVVPPSTKNIGSPRLPPQRVLRRQRSSPDIPTSAVGMPPQPRRKIASVDSLTMKRDGLYVSPRLLRRPLTYNFLEPAAPLSRSSSNLLSGNQSKRQRKISTGSYSAYARRERSESTGSYPERFPTPDVQLSAGDVSPEIPQRLHSQTNQRPSSQRTITRKISCPQPIRGMRQEEFFDLHVNRNRPQNVDRSEGTRSRASSELPPLDEPSSREPNFRNLSVSPVGRHMEGLDEMLQVRVNNFLMSLESFRKDNGEENGEGTCSSSAFAKF